jgi:hypothetical protein
MAANHNPVSLAARRDIQRHVPALILLLQDKVDDADEGRPERFSVCIDNGQRTLKVKLDVNMVFSRQREVVLDGFSQQWLELEKGPCESLRVSVFSQLHDEVTYSIQASSDVGCVFAYFLQVSESCFEGIKVRRNSEYETA